MTFSERPPSNQWAALKYGGEKFAEVWFKPDGQPLALTFRVPPISFQIPDMGELLTAANLLRAVGVAADEVESWRPEGASAADPEASHSDLENPLPPPDADYLVLHFHLTPPLQDVVVDEDLEPEIPETKWQDLAARWKAILDVEASMESLRITMEGLRTELDAASRRMLTPDEKLHALNADVAQWTKAKSRAHYAVPKVREFIHRATWAPGAPERKRLEELFQNHIRPRIAFAWVEEAADQLDGLLRDRQAMVTHGASVYQECKAVAADLQGVLRTLQSNAAANAVKQRGATIAKSKFF